MDIPNQITIKTEVQYLRGVGPKRGQILKSYGISNIGDLIRNFPRKYLDRTNVKNINQIKINEQVVIIGTVKSFGLKYLKKGKYFQLNISDETGFIQCIWFHGISWISEKFKEGDNIAVFGKVEFYKGYRIIHPEFDLLENSKDPSNTGQIIPLYASNNLFKKVSLDSRAIRKLIHNALNQVYLIKDHFSEHFLKKEALLSLDKSIRIVHQPNSNDDLKSAYYRLKFDEYFFLQLVLAINKYQLSNFKGKKFIELGDYAIKMYKSLDFKLTNAQIRVMREIRKDLAMDKPMNRLVQGDVGCGKTIIAMLTSAIIVGNDSQVAIMAPTEILAEQHFESFFEFCSKLNIKCKLLIGNLKQNQKNQIYEDLENGRIQIIVGTHALIQEKVKFKNLELVVVDEQHRFGVEQRKNLITKGKHVNILSMTATPIPRTLTFAIHGDMDLSWIDELPQNRIPIKTSVIESKKIDSVYTLMKNEMDKGRFCFIVFPIIEESDKIDAEAAESAYENFKKNIFKEYTLGFLHGKLKKESKTQIMEQVNNGEIQCLISTTVVEVGINNPNATVMVIENAERFGLTQLHQLRGRIGRGKFQSYCFLIQRKKTEQSFKRLSIIEKHIDGFKISDEDLKLRGPGEFLGTKQHGHISSKLLDIVNDGKIMRHARTRAFEIIENDPKLIKSQNLKKKLLQDYRHMLEFINIG
ncbi:MAG: ATP-dependent DNA helicase RecG [Candidatus Marinimicrobia bacterium]|nr:ATP-dependent DNA helicase RecG [Candidatus Neomarinimicrobiota bacterium]